MEKKILIGKYNDSTGKIQQEELEENYIGESAEEIYKRLIRDFNSEEKERYGEKADIREFVFAEWKDEQSKGIIYCDFRKTNAGTLNEGRRFFDRFVCEKCGRVKRVYGINSGVLKNVKCRKQEDGQ